MENKYFVSAADKPYDYERDEALRDALKLVGRRRETVQFWDGFNSDGCRMLYRVSSYLHNELTKVFGGRS